jgi:hypothetical protein
MSFLVITLTPILATLLHYEFLTKLTKIHIKHRLSLVFIVLLLLISHILQVLIFAIGFYVLSVFDLGNLHYFNNPANTQSITDFIYFSFTTFSTLGYGDLNPLGAFRFLAGLEALLGFILITWSASFLYFEMQKYWNKSQ